MVMVEITLTGTRNLSSEISFVLENYSPLSTALSQSFETHCPLLPCLRRLDLRLWQEEAFWIHSPRLRDGTGYYMAIPGETLVAFY